MTFLDSLRRPRAELDAPLWLSRAMVAVVVLVAVVAPLVSAPYVNFDRSMVLVYIVVGLGLNLLTGNTGQISLGHGFFFAVGAYLSGVLVENHGVPYLLLLPLAFVVCYLVGYAFGLPALRLRGLQLALATLGLALVTPAVIKRFEHVTDGHAGINISAADAPGFTGLERDQWVYYLCLVVALVASLAGALFGTPETGTARPAASVVSGIVADRLLVDVDTQARPVGHSERAAGLVERGGEQVVLVRIVVQGARVAQRASRRRRRLR